jgi:hypothetical protein
MTLLTREEVEIYAGPHIDHITRAVAQSLLHYMDEAARLRAALERISKLGENLNYGTAQALARQDCPK